MRSPLSKTPFSALLRKGEYEVFNRIARAHKMKLHEKLELPAAVRDILQSPKSELKIGVLEDLRKAIVSCTVGEKYIQVDCEEAEQLAQAIERCTGRFGEVGKGSELLPAGARVVVDAARNKAELLADVRAKNGDWLKVELFPFGTCRAPLVSAFYKKMEKTPANVLADELGDNAMLLDRMLLALHDALWLQKSDEWSRQGVANLPQDETPELARWFMRGRTVGKKRCSMAD